MSALSAGMSRPGEMILLLAVLLLAACSTFAAPVYEHDTTHLAEYQGEPGCYYNFQRYQEGDRIVTNEPCLNCTCHNRMLMCYLRVCPFTKAIGQDCTVEKRPDQCCPIITCPEVPVQLLTSTTNSPATVGSTEIGAHDNYGCHVEEKFYADGAQLPIDPRNPCELCYCIRNKTTCVMQDCTLRVAGCNPVYQSGVCCPVKYNCDYDEEQSTTVSPTTPGLIMTTTVAPGANEPKCYHKSRIYNDGELMHSEHPCEHCYCFRGDIVCAVQDCAVPLKTHGKHCTPLPPPQGKCCATAYQCDGESSPLQVDEDTAAIDLFPGQYPEILQVTQSSIPASEDQEDNDSQQQQGVEGFPGADNKIPDQNGANEGTNTEGSIEQESVKEDDIAQQTAKPYDEHTLSVETPTEVPAGVTDDINLEQKPTDATGVDEVLEADKKTAILTEEIEPTKTVLPEQPAVIDHEHPVPSTEDDEAPQKPIELENEVPTVATVAGSKPEDKVEPAVSVDEGTPISVLPTEGVNPDDQITGTEEVSTIKTLLEETPKPADGTTLIQKTEDGSGAETPEVSSIDEKQPTESSIEGKPEEPIIEDQKPTEVPAVSEPQPTIESVSENQPKPVEEGAVEDNEPETGSEAIEKSTVLPTEAGNIEHDATTEPEVLVTDAALPTEAKPTDGSPLIPDDAATEGSGHDDESTSSSKPSQPEIIPELPTEAVTVDEEATKEPAVPVTEVVPPTPATPTDSSLLTPDDGALEGSGHDEDSVSTLQPTQQENIPDLPTTDVPAVKVPVEGESVAPDSHAENPEKKPVTDAIEPTEASVAAEKPDGGESAVTDERPATETPTLSELPSNTPIDEEHAKVPTDATITKAELPAEPVIVEEKQPEVSIDVPQPTQPTVHDHEPSAEDEIPTEGPAGIPLPERVPVHKADDTHPVDEMQVTEVYNDVQHSHVPDSLVIDTQTNLPATYIPPAQSTPESEIALGQGVTEATEHGVAPHEAQSTVASVAQDEVPLEAGVPTKLPIVDEEATSGPQGSIDEHISHEETEHKTPIEADQQPTEGTQTENQPLEHVEDDQHKVDEQTSEDAAKPTESDVQVPASPEVSTGTEEGRPDSNDVSVTDASIGVNPTESQEPTDDKQHLVPAVNENLPGKTITDEETPSELPVSGDHASTGDEQQTQGPSVSVELPGGTVGTDGEPLEVPSKGEEDGESSTAEAKPTEASVIEVGNTEGPVTQEKPTDASQIEDEATGVIKEKPTESSSAEEPSPTSTAEENPINPVTVDEKPTEASISQEHLTEGSVHDQEPIEPVSGVEQKPSDVLIPEHPTEGTVTQEEPTEGSTIDQQSVDVSVTEEKPTESSLPEETPTDASIDVQKVIEPIIDGGKPGDASADEEKPTESSAIHHEPTVSSVDAEKPTEAVITGEKVTPASISEDETSESSGIEAKPTDTAVVNDIPTEAVVGEDESTNVPNSEQKPTETSIIDQEPTVTSGIDEKQPEISVAGETPTRTVSVNEQTDAPSDIEQKPTDGSAIEERPTNVPVVGKDEVTGVPVVEENLTQGPITEQSVTEIPTANENPTEVSVSEDKAPKISADGEKPTEIPITGDKTSDDSLVEQKPTEISIGKPESTDGTIIEQNPTEASTDEEKPTGTPIADNKVTDTPVVEEKPTEATVLIEKTAEPTTVNPIESSGTNNNPAEPTIAGEQPIEASIPTDVPAVTGEQEPTELSVPGEQPTANPEQATAGIPVDDNQQTETSNTDEATESSINNEKPSVPSGVDENSSESSLPEKTPTDASVTEERPTEGSITQEKITETPVDVVTPTDTSVVDKKPTEAVVAEVEPTEVSSTEEKITDSFVDQTHSTDASVGEVKPTDASVPTVIETEVTEVNPVETSQEHEKPVEPLLPEGKPSDAADDHENPTEISVIAPTENSDIDNKVKESSVTEEKPSDEKPTEPSRTEEHPTEVSDIDNKATESSVIEGKPSNEKPTEPSLTEANPTDVSGIDHTATESSVTDAKLAEEKPSEPSPPVYPTETSGTDNEVTRSPVTEEKPSDERPTEPSLTQEHSTDISGIPTKVTESSVSDEETSDLKPTEPSLMEEHSTDDSDVLTKVTESSVTDEKPSDEKPTEPSLTEEHSTDVSGIHTKVTESSVTEGVPSDEKTTEPSLTEEQPTEISTVDDKVTKSSVSEEQPSSPSGTNETPVEPSVAETTPTEGSIKEAEATETPLTEEKPSVSSETTAIDAKVTESSVSEEKPTATSHDEEPPTQTITVDGEPAEPSVEVQKPVDNSVSAENPSTSSEEEVSTQSTKDGQSPIQPSIDEQQPIEPGKPTLSSEIPHEDENVEQSTIPHFPSSIPGEGNCLVDGQSFANNSAIPPANLCQLRCHCVSSIVHCDLVECSPPPAHLSNCMPVHSSSDSCCPIYSCDSVPTVELESDSQMAEHHTPGYEGITQPATTSDEGTPAHIPSEKEHEIEPSTPVDEHAAEPSAEVTPSSDLQTDLPVDTSVIPDDQKTVQPVEQDVVEPTDAAQGEPGVVETNEIPEQPASVDQEPSSKPEIVTEIINPIEPQTETAITPAGEPELTVTEGQKTTESSVVPEKDVTTGEEPASVSIPSVEGTITTGETPVSIDEQSNVPVSPVTDINESVDEHSTESVTTGAEHLVEPVTTDKESQTGHTEAPKLAVDVESETIPTGENDVPVEPATSAEIPLDNKTSRPSEEAATSVPVVVTQDEEQSPEIIVPVEKDTTGLVTPTVESGTEQSTTSVHQISPAVDEDHADHTEHAELPVIDEHEQTPGSIGLTETSTEIRTDKPIAEDTDNLTPPVEHPGKHVPDSQHESEGQSTESNQPIEVPSHPTDQSDLTQQPETSEPVGIVDSSTVGTLSEAEATAPTVGTEDHSESVQTGASDLPKDTTITAPTVAGQEEGVELEGSTVASVSHVDEEGTGTDNDIALIDVTTSGAPSQVDTETSSPTQSVEVTPTETSTHGDDEAPTPNEDVLGTAGPVEEPTSSPAINEDVQTSEGVEPTVESISPDSAKQTTPGADIEAQTILVDGNVVVPVSPESTATPVSEDHELPAIEPSTVGPVSHDEVETVAPTGSNEDQAIETIEPTAGPITPEHAETPKPSIEDETTSVEEPTSQSSVPEGGSSTSVPEENAGDHGTPILEPTAGPVEPGHVETPTPTVSQEDEVVAAETPTTGSILVESTETTAPTLGVDSQTVADIEHGASPVPSDHAEAPEPTVSGAGQPVVAGEPNEGIQTTEPEAEGHTTSTLESTASPAVPEDVKILAPTVSEEGETVKEEQSNTGEPPHDDAETPAPVDSPKDQTVGVQEPEPVLPDQGVTVVSPAGEDETTAVQQPAVEPSSDDTEVPLPTVSGEEQPIPVQEPELKPVTPDQTETSVPVVTDEPVIIQQTIVPVLHEQTEPSTPTESGELENIPTSQPGEPEPPTPTVDEEGGSISIDGTITSEPVSDDQTKSVTTSATPSDHSVLDDTTTSASASSEGAETPAPVISTNDNVPPIESSTAGPVVAEDNTEAIAPATDTQTTEAESPTGTPVSTDHAETPVPTLGGEEDEQQTGEQQTVGPATHDDSEAPAPTAGTPDETIPAEVPTHEPISSDHAETPLPTLTREGEVHAVEQPTVEPVSHDGEVPVATAVVPEEPITAEIPITGPISPDHTETSVPTPSEGGESVGAEQPTIEPVSYDGEVPASTAGTPEEPITAEIPISGPISPDHAETPAPTPSEGGEIVGIEQPTVEPLSHDAETPAPATGTPDETITVEIPTAGPVSTDHAETPLSTTSVEGEHIAGEQPTVEPHGHVDTSVATESTEDENIAVEEKTTVPSLIEHPETPTPTLVEVEPVVAELPTDHSGPSDHSETPVPEVKPDDDTLATDEINKPKPTEPDTSADHTPEEPAGHPEPTGVPVTESVAEEGPTPSTVSESVKPDTEIPATGEPSKQGEEAVDEIPIEQKPEETPIPPQAEHPTEISEPEPKPVTEISEEPATASPVESTQSTLVEGGTTEDVIIKGIPTEEKPVEPVTVVTEDEKPAVSEPTDLPTEEQVTGDQVTEGSVPAEPVPSVAPESQTDEDQQQHVQTPDQFAEIPEHPTADDSEGQITVGSDDHPLPPIDHAVEDIKHPTTLGYFGQPITSTSAPLGSSAHPDQAVSGVNNSHFPINNGSYLDPESEDNDGSDDYDEDDQAIYGPGTCRYGGKVYVSAQQIPRDDPCDFCFCFRSDIICLQQSCPPPIPNCHEEPINGFCCPRYECPVSMAMTMNVTTTTTTTTTTLPPHFLSHAYKGAARRSGCQIRGQPYQVGEVIPSASGPCLQCTCGGDGNMKCEPRVCSPEPMLRQMIAAATAKRRR